MHKHGRDYYLSDIPLDEAIRKFDGAIARAAARQHTASERVPLDRANGRVTAEPVWANVPLPTTTLLLWTASRSVPRTRWVHRRPVPYDCPLETMRDGSTQETRCQETLTP